MECDAAGEEIPTANQHQQVCPAGNNKYDQLNAQVHEHIAVHSSMMAILREKSIHSYSFTPKEMKQTALVLRGLTPNTEIESIKSELDTLVPDTVANIVKFTTANSIKNKIDTGLFLVSLLPGKNISDVSKVTGLQNQIIEWEKPKKKGTEIQCRRCQRWGHISRNCNSGYRCVKCDQNHNPGECQRKREDNMEPYCNNCEEAGHPANWRGCPTYKKYAAARRQRIAKAAEERTIAKNNVQKVIRSSNVIPDLSFADLFQSRSVQHSVAIPKPPSIIEQFMKLSSFFLEPEELSIEQEVNIFLSEYTKMPKTEAKTEFLRILNKIKSKYGP
ncbi:uncharacterized protein LOC142225479 [Haematobia irritans]|uniref:uncharacterized protein LOC142225479 n=1 Tax=Haematobia irritans TaxID=7368 RepID=UPI003F505960